jgi:hypothetical protein
MSRIKEIVRIGRRFLVLGVMLAALGLVTYSDVFVTPTAAAPCCSSCEVYPGDDEVTYCENYCATSDRSCYDRCIRRVYNCWQWCSFSC